MEGISTTVLQRLQSIREGAKDERVSIHNLRGSRGILPREHFEIRVPWMAGNAQEILQMSCFCEFHLLEWVSSWRKNTLWTKLPRSDPSPSPLHCSCTDHARRLASCGTIFPHGRSVVHRNWSSRDLWMEHNYPWRQNDRDNIGCLFSYEFTEKNLIVHILLYLQPDWL